MTKRQAVPLAQPMDRTLLWLTVLIVVGGLLMVYSASYAIAVSEHRKPYYYVSHQMVWAAVGFLALFLGSRMDFWILRAHRNLLLALTLASLVLVFIPPFGGGDATHTHRWLHLGPLSFQPSELAKLVMVLYLASFLAERQHRLSSGGGVRAWPFLVIVTIAGLVFAEPHLSAAMVLTAVGTLLILLAGVPWRRVLIALALVGALMLCGLRSYQMERITALVKGGDPKGSNYQPRHTVLALQAGRWLGRGLGKSQEKHLYLPAAHTDYIFAIIGEELGFVGTSGVLFLFGLLISRGFTIAQRSGDRFASLFCSGFSSLIGLQLVLNVGVATRLLPATGVPLPLISFGGSALVSLMLGIGFMLNISRYPDLVLEAGRNETGTGGGRDGRTHLPGHRLGRNRDAGSPQEGRAGGDDSDYFRGRALGPRVRTGGAGRL